MVMKGKILAVILVLAIGIPLLAWVSQLDMTPIDIPSRESMIPVDVVKVTPETDLHPPMAISDEYEQPVP